jgi:hypothetical protein
MELTEEQIDRQDLVDNACHCLIEELAEQFHCSTVDIDWDIEDIGRIRDVVQDIIVNKLKLCSEKEFYPFVEEPVFKNEYGN